MIRVLIADDHAVVREGLKEILRDTADITVAGEAMTAAEVLTKAQSIAIDVVLLDISMPGTADFATLAQLRRDHPKLPILVLSMHSEQHYGIRVLRAGASGYLMKDTAPDQLVIAIRKVASGAKYVSPSLAERIAHGFSIPDRPSHDLLSDREYAVLCAIGRGKAISEISADLGVSVKTVSTYRTRLLVKMSLQNNAELVRYVVQHGLLDDGTNPSSIATAED